ncbi:hypothetical protein EAG_03429 [Camponotus floridanus]|uniref:Uncharacterized protein n=1 Tax=Camponotus floridanus TaxID=104421 RepID=E2AR97_CAMFO|nr:hypothetical protein EAG_03429 [Camponotus floridanus]
MPHLYYEISLLCHKEFNSARIEKSKVKNQSSKIVYKLDIFVLRCVLEMAAYGVSATISDRDLVIQFRTVNATSSFQALLRSRTETSSYSFELIITWFELWKKTFIDILFTIILRVAFDWEYRREMELPGFVNIEQRQWVRIMRRAIREDVLDIWGDTPDSRHRQVFDLRRFFGEEPYLEIIEEEEWILEEEWEDLVAPAECFFL